MDNLAYVIITLAVTGIVGQVLLNGRNIRRGWQRIRGWLAYSVNMRGKR